MGEILGLGIYKIETNNLIFGSKWFAKDMMYIEIDKQKA